MIVGLILWVLGMIAMIVFNIAMARKVFKKPLGLGWFAWCVVTGAAYGFIATTLLLP